MSIVNCAVFTSMSPGQFSDSSTWRIALSMLELLRSNNHPPLADVKESDFLTGSKSGSVTGSTDTAAYDIEVLTRIAKVDSERSSLSLSRPVFQSLNLSIYQSLHLSISPAPSLSISQISLFTSRFPLPHRPHSRITPLIFPPFVPSGLPSDGQHQ